MTLPVTPRTADSHGDPRHLGFALDSTDPITIGGGSRNVVPPDEPPRDRRSKKLQGKPKHTPVAAAAADSPVKRLDSSTGTYEYRELAGNRRLTEDQRTAMVYIAMALARAAKGGELIRAKIAAAKLGTAVIAHTADSDAVRLELLPELEDALLKRKAISLMRICGSPLSPEVKDYAYCHCSSKAGLTLAAVGRLESYVGNLLRNRPSQQEFERNYDTWWPDFNE